MLRLSEQGLLFMLRGTEPLQIWEIISSPAGHAALQYAAENGNPPLEPLVGLIEDWWGAWLDDDREENIEQLHRMVERLMVAAGWEEAGLRPTRHWQRITEAMAYRRTGAGTGTLQ
ncbi:MAG TPA: hypothetical protein VL574_10505 [Stellaceae bacterium]|nr:hypothetical protein [Stellaceae bacterium]